MHILHTEASSGWGGQEIRILREAIAMRERGHTVVFATLPGAHLYSQAKAQGFTVYTTPFRWGSLLPDLQQLRTIIRSEQIDIINTHSSLDAWIAGLAGRMFGVKVVRTRHISAPIKAGLNSKLLYNRLAQGVATTCEEVAERIRRQAALGQERCKSIPTGIDPQQLNVSAYEAQEFRHHYGIAKQDFLVGTACVLRSWKGIADLLHAIKLMEARPQLKCIIVGSGPIENDCKHLARRLGLSERVIFTGHLSPPYVAIQAMDVFCLLSTANEGVSQASLQAAYLQRPLITTRTGGLAEVCCDGVTGWTVDTHAPEQVAQRIGQLMEEKEERQKMGSAAHELALSQFSWEHTVNEMEALYASVSR